MKHYKHYDKADSCMYSDCYISVTKNEPKITSIVSALW